jgi:hypothetical protein
MKAVLAKHGLDIPKTHDLPYLLDLTIVPVPSLAILDQMVLDLNDFSVVVRYPSLIPLEEADAKDAIYLASPRIDSEGGARFADRESPSARRQYKKTPA